MKEIGKTIFYILITLAATAFVGLLFGIVSFGFTYLIGDNLFVERAVATTYLGFGIVLGQVMFNGIEGLKKVFFLPNSKEGDEQ